MNPWEDGVLQEEFSRPDFVAWLRNLDRKNWSIEIPYRVAGINKPMYPDMMIVRQDAHGYIFDILEPHDSSRADNYPKAKGLAEFAQTHSNAYGRIQLIRKLTGADGASHFYRLINTISKSLWILSIVIFQHTKSSLHQFIITNLTILQLLKWDVVLFVDMSALERL